MAPDRADRPGAPLQGRRRPAHHRTGPPPRRRRARRRHRVVERAQYPARALPRPADRRRARRRTLPAYPPPPGLVPPRRLAGRGPPPPPPGPGDPRPAHPPAGPALPGHPGRPRRPGQSPAHGRDLPQRAPARAPSRRHRAHQGHCCGGPGRSSRTRPPGRAGASLAPGATVRTVARCRRTCPPPPRKIRHRTVRVSRPGAASARTGDGARPGPQARSGCSSSGSSAPTRASTSCCGPWRGAPASHPDRGRRVLGQAEAATRTLIDDLGLAGRVTLRPGYVPADQIPALFAGTGRARPAVPEATASQNAWLAFEFGVPVIVTTRGDAGRRGAGRRGRADLRARGRGGSAPRLARHQRSADRAAAAGRDQARGPGAGLGCLPGGSAER